MLLMVILYSLQVVKTILFLFYYKLDRDHINLHLDTKWLLHCFKMERIKTCEILVILIAGFTHMLTLDTVGFYMLF